MLSRKEENFHLNGFIMGVLRSAEILCKEYEDSSKAEHLLNALLDGKLRFITIKRLAKSNKIDIPWDCLDIIIKRTH